ncbi:MAG: class I SAM-dependent methyltransferase [Carboxylicivirga sp.]|jgi:trans-aconitate methyltransferase|nr:class I SAM-dependent methyltransferase [Carboxylicivirga sp.]
MSESFFEKEKNVRQYLEMTADYDGQWFLVQFLKHIPKEYRALELGIGPGKDLENIRQHYDVVGSDYSFVFAELYKRSHPEVKIMVLDAVSIKVKEQFDCIYTNKVLHHLPTEDLIQSLQRQSEVLNQDGLVFHTFWRGSGQDKYDDLLFNYYETNELKKFFEQHYTILCIEYYKELKENDSILVVAQKTTK